jgi:hypothetical protein
VAAEDAVADPELVFPEQRGVRAEAAGAEHQGVSCLVERADVGAAVGDHHRRGRVEAGDVPPALEQPLSGLERVVVDVQPAALGGVGEVGLGVAAAQAGERLPFRELVLAAVLGQLERAELLGQGWVEAAGADGRELGGVADQDRLSLRALDELEDRCEHACFGHARLVDDEHAAVWQAFGSVGVEQEPVQGAARDPGRDLELVGGAAARRCADYRHVALGVDLVERVQGGGLAGAGDTGDADDAVTAERGPMHEPLLLARQLAVKERPQHSSPVGGGRADITAVDPKLERVAFDLEQLARCEPRRPAWEITGLELLDAGEARQLGGGLEHLLDRRACGERASDGADELGQRERGLRRGQPVRREQPAGQCLAVERAGDERPLVGEPGQFAASEPDLGRADQPLLAQPG